MDKVVVVGEEETIEVNKGGLKHMGGGKVVIARLCPRHGRERSVRGQAVEALDCVNVAILVVCSENDPELICESAINTLDPCLGTN